MHFFPPKPNLLPLFLYLVVESADTKVWKQHRCKSLLEEQLVLVKDYFQLRNFLHMATCLWKVLCPTSHINFFTLTKSELKTVTIYGNRFQTTVLTKEAKRLNSVSRFCLKFVELTKFKWDSNYFISIF